MTVSKVIRWLHVVWAILGAAICILLATAKGGHPPALVLIPVAATMWLAGHGLLWTSQKLIVRGKRFADTRDTGSGNWPLAIILLVVLSGIVFIFGLFGIVWQISFGRDWLREMAVPLAVWMPFSLCFFGILLRQDWSRLLAGSGFIVAALILLAEMIASHMRGYRNPATEWVIVIVMFALLILLGQYILRSARIKAFYSKV